MSAPSKPGVIRIAVDDTCQGCSAREHSVCRDLTREELARLAASGHSVQLPAHATLFEAGALAEFFYSVTEGTLAVYELLPDGRRQIIDFPQAGDFIGVSLGEHYRSTAQTLTPVTVCRFPRALFERIQHDTPTLEHGVLRRAGDQLEAAQLQMTRLGRKTAIERVASFLEEMAQRQKLPPGQALHLPMTRADIADYLGLTTETVSRSITRLRTLRLIEPAAADSLVLRDRAALARTASGQGETPARA